MCVEKNSPVSQVRSALVCVKTNYLTKNNRIKKIPKWLSNHHRCEVRYAWPFIRESQSGFQALRRGVRHLAGQSLAGGGDKRPLAVTSSAPTRFRCVGLLLGLDKPCPRCHVLLHQQLLLSLHPLECSAAACARRRGAQQPCLGAVCDSLRRLRLRRRWRWTR